MIKKSLFIIIIILSSIVVFTTPIIIYIFSKNQNWVNIYAIIIGNIITIIYISIIFYQNWVIKSDLGIEYKDENLFYMKNTDENGQYQVLRVLAKNKGKKILDNCEAKAEIYQFDHNNKKIMKEDAAILHWSRNIITNEEEVNIKEDFKPININRGDKEFLDVIKLYDESFLLFSDRLFKNIGTEYVNGTYQIKLTIYSKDLPKPKSEAFNMIKGKGFTNVNFKKI